MIHVDRQCLNTGKSYLRGEWYRLVGASIWLSFVFVCLTSKKAKVLCFCLLFYYCIKICRLERGCKERKVCWLCVNMYTRQATQGI